jgi:hypothetical protein
MHGDYHRYPGACPGTGFGHIARLGSRYCLVSSQETQKERCLTTAREEPTNRVSRLRGGPLPSEDAVLETGALPADRVRKELRDQLRVVWLEALRIRLLVGLRI